MFMGSNIAVFQPRLLQTPVASGSRGQVAPEG